MKTIPPRPAATLGTPLIWGLLLLLLVANVPLFLCQHLTADAVLYDLQARCALSGGVLYQDLVEPNFPGVVWLHMLVRSLFGWSAVALRAVDLTIIAGIAALLARLSSPHPSFRDLRTALISLGTFGLYFSLSEWCQCQRDTWMLLPCLGAVCLRQRSASTASPARWTLAPLIEGALWGLAIWLKPHVTLPALVVAPASVRLTGFTRAAVRSLLAVVAGAVLIGLIGCGWLWSTGAWKPFWEMQLQWNPEYLRAGREKMSFARLLALWDGFAPWSWLHISAIAAVVVNVRKLTSSPQISARGTFLLSALYFGWMLQIFLLQHPFAYVHLPGILLALGLTASLSLPTTWERTAWIAGFFFAMFALLHSPATDPRRLSAWWACITQGPTPEVRSRIQIETRPDWQELAPVLDFLREQNLRDGELTAYSGGLIQLYPQLGLMPPTRYVYLDVLARLFRTKTSQIHEAVEQSPQKFVVSSLKEAGMSESAIADEIDPETQLPRCFPPERLKEFPYTQPVVFRSGQYLVHRVINPIGPLCIDYFPLANARPSHTR